MKNFFLNRIFKVCHTHGNSHLPCPPYTHSKAGGTLIHNIKDKGIAKSLKILTLTTLLMASPVKAQGIPVIDRDCSLNCVI